jgi:hypothetical protein
MPSGFVVGAQAKNDKRCQKACGAAYGYVSDSVTMRPNRRLGCDEQWLDELVADGLC